MADDHIPESMHERRMDPVGLDLPLRILSLAVSILSLLKQVRISIKGPKGIKHRLLELRKDVIRLHNCLDELILTVERYLDDQQLRNGEEHDLISEGLTVSKTMMRLKETDFVRWLDVQNRIDEIAKRVYSVIREVHHEIELLDDQPEVEHLTSEIVAPFDQLFVRIHEISFSDFLLQLRSALHQLYGFLSYLVQHNDTQGGSRSREE